MAAEKVRAAIGNTTLHRLQIGVAGIFAVLVMVALADMLLQRAGGDVPAGEVVTAQPGMAPPVSQPPVQPPAASEPLADLGVVPDLPADSAQHSAGGQAPSVDQLPPAAQTAPAPAPQQ